MGDLDFPGVARAALEQASLLLPQWVGGKRRGHEWFAERKANGGPGDSWVINLNTGVWSHFASGVAGHDIIGFYAALKNIGQGAAFREIAAMIGENPNRVPVLPHHAPPEPVQAALEPIPPDAAPVRDHPEYGTPSAVYRYGNQFVVVRYDLPGGDKWFSQLTWRNGNWVLRGPGRNRPLFHVEQLRIKTEDPVLIVEGEKCVELAQPLLPGYAVLTWAGGAAAWRQSDWSPLEGRNVVIWPDADDPGRKAAAEISAHLTRIAAKVRVINPNGADPGWDVGDAILKDHWDEARILEWAKSHIGDEIKAQASTAVSNSIPPVEPGLPPLAQTRSRIIDANDDGTSSIVTWAQLGLACNGKGIPHVSTANGSAILQRHPRFRGQIWFDDFCGEVYHTLRGGPQPWTDLDTRRITVFIQEQLDLHKFSITLMHEAVSHAAECNIRNPVTEWLNSLEWDGEERLSTWLFDCAGVDNNEYTQAISRNWPIAMVARAFRPGCKMDNMPVLEGVSGLNKTQFLEVLGGEWYKALPMEFGSKDFKQALRGAWLVEIPDMTGFGRVAHSQVLAELSIPIDVYRQSYGRKTAKYPRTCVFAATSETNDYLSDSRGKRRYWPVHCRDINLETLRYQRPRIFAEAVHLYRQGVHWYDMPASAAHEQLARTEMDPWEQFSLEYANDIWEQHRRGVRQKPLTSEEILVNALGMKTSDLKQSDKIRLKRLMEANGWNQDRTSRLRYWTKTESIT